MDLSLDGDGPKDRGKALVGLGLIKPLNLPIQSESPDLDKHLVKLSVPSSTGKLTSAGSFSTGLDIFIAKIILQNGSVP